MNKRAPKIFSIFFFLFLAASTCSAAVLEYDAGTYEPQGHLDTIYTNQTINLHHYYYYTLGLRDLNDGREIDVLNVVFHDIYNWTIEDNWLNVYIFDEAATLGWKRVDIDYENVTSPDWSLLYNATCLGTWSYVEDAKDVVFTTSDSSLLAYLQGGQSFGIGIDPDCHFLGSNITVETNAPVPEPTTLILLGIGILSLIGFRKRSS